MDHEFHNHKTFYIRYMRYLFIIVFVSFGLNSSFNSFCFGFFIHWSYIIFIIDENTMGRLFKRSLDNVYESYRLNRV